EEPDPFSQNLLTRCHAAVGKELIDLVQDQDEGLVLTSFQPGLVQPQELFPEGILRAGRIIRSYLDSPNGQVFKKLPDDLAKQILSHRRVALAVDPGRGCESQPLPQLIDQRRLAHFAKSKKSRVLALPQDRREPFEQIVSSEKPGRIRNRTGFVIR